MLKKITFKAGINRELTRYAAEGGWYDCDKVRFRQGFPEKIGGWVRLSTNVFLGVCRSLWNWITLASVNLVGVGTHLKFYVEEGGVYNDITPIRASASLTNPFATTDGLAVVTVTDTAHGAVSGDYVTFSGAAAVAGLTLNSEYALTKIDADTYTITAAANANATVAAGGGATVTAAYQLNVGADSYAPLVGWGAGGWGLGAWGTATSATSIRLWSQSNFGEDLIFCPRGGGLYYWDATTGVTARGVLVSSLGGASDVPTLATSVLVSDIHRFVFALGVNDVGSATLDPMLIRWSDQESAVNWTPGATTKAGGLPLSRGSQIVTGRQARQEILVWTDAALYSLQFTGYDTWWGATLVGDGISIIGPNAVASANGTTYWMGKDNFYMYDGRLQNLKCDVDRYVFDDMNALQSEQVCCGTNEGFSEIWWHYCSGSSSQNDRYVVFNYADGTWYYGTLARTAWLDSPLRSNPVAATYSNNLVYHESGLDDNVSGTAVGIAASITSAPFDLDDGDQIMLVRRILPDVAFEGSTAASPAGTLTIYAMKNAGTGYTSPASMGGTNTAAVTRTAESPIEAFTGQVFVRVRGRQLALKFESSALGVQWQLGAPRLDIKPDGKR